MKTSLSRPIKWTTDQFQGRGRFRQRGIATVLTVLLAGMSLTAIVLGAMYYVRSTQSQLLSVHAQTQAQMRAWTTVEAVRKYLNGVKANSKLAVLAQKVSESGNNLLLTITGLNGVSASLIGVDSTSDPKQFTALISGEAASDTAANSKSAVKVVFELDSTTTDITENDMKGNYTNKNLKLSGGISATTEEKSAFVVSVNGDFTTGGNSITGVSTIRSTGSISIGSGSSFEELHANCDVVLTGSVTSESIKARRNACLTGEAAGTGTILANGTVYAQAGYDKNGAISASGNAADVSACRSAGSSDDGSNYLAATCSELADGIVVDLSSGSAGAKSVNAKGDVTLASGRVGDLAAEGNLILANWGAKVDSGIVGGIVSAPKEAPGMKDSVNNVQESSGLSVSIETVPRVTIDTYVIDANDYKSIANYVFSVDSSGYKKVTVFNVSGISSGEYYIGSFKPNYQTYADYLCPTLASGSTTSSPVCSLTGTTASALTTICKGDSPYTPCFSYNADTKTWTIQGESMAQGVAWFAGNLSIIGKTYFNTFVATGNITTGGGNKVYAPNYAGYSGTVSETVDGTVRTTQHAPTGMCENTNFPTLYPKQFCDKTNKAFLPDANNGIGNYAFIAGSIPEGTTYSEDTYVGGNITTGGGSEIFGNLLAGNEFVSTGDTTIHGYSAALAAGVATRNAMTGKTTYIVKNLPSTFDPSKGQKVKSTTSTTTTYAFKVKWATYL